MEACQCNFSAFKALTDKL